MPVPKLPKKLPKETKELIEGMIAAARGGPRVDVNAQIAAMEPSLRKTTEKALRDWVFKLIQAAQQTSIDSRAHDINLVASVIEVVLNPSDAKAVEDLLLSRTHDYTFPADHAAESDALAAFVRSRPRMGTAFLKRIEKQKRSR